MPGAAQHKAIFSGTITPATGCVFREDSLHYLYSHFIYNPNSKSGKIKYVMDKFMQDRATQPQHQLTFNR